MLRRVYDSIRSRSSPRQPLRALRQLLWPAVLLLTACGVSVDRDGAPAGGVDLSQVPDTEPRVERYSRYGNPPSYVFNGRRYHTLSSSQGYRERGIASWYGQKFHGRRTSSREVYDMYAMTAAHKTLPLPTYARVTNLENGRQVVVRINDRGPFHANRIIDLSYTAASRLGILERGTGLVQVEAIEPESAPAEVASLERFPSKALDLYLQVGAFASRDNAMRLKQRVSVLAQAPVQISELVHERESLYRVRLGPLSDVEQADQLVERLAQLGIHDSHVILE